MEKEELQALAKQLSCPKGDLGKEIGLRMNQSNFGMILSGIEAIQISENDRILELGPGNAAHVNDIFSLNENLKYIGLEISETMVLEACFNNQVLYGEEKVDFQLYDGENIPFENERFDKIFTVNTLYFWNNPHRLLSEIYRVLSKRGFFVLVYLDKETLDSYCEKAVQSYKEIYGKINTFYKKSCSMEIIRHMIDKIF